MNDLLPCPFCGNPACIKRGKTVMVSCSECTASTFQIQSDPKSAIAAWNRRAVAAPVEGLTDALLEIDEMACDGLLPRRTPAQMRMQFKKIINEVRPALSAFRIQSQRESAS